MIDAEKGYVDSNMHFVRIACWCSVLSIAGDIAKSHRVEMNRKAIQSMFIPEGLAKLVFYKPLFGLIDIQYITNVELFQMSNSLFYADSVSDLNRKRLSQWIWPSRRNGCTYSARQFTRGVKISKRMATARPVDDGAVQDTANDAVQSKASASTLGYFHDPYVQAMSKKATRRSPLINRGYYTRVAVVRDLARAFVRQARSDQAPCQVLSLGGGFDTLYFTLRDENLAPDSYIEIDYPEVMQRKHRMLQTISALSKAVNSQATKIGTSVVMAAPQYYLVSANLRDLPALDTKLDSIPIRRDYRTLFLSECALVYMSGSDADAVIAWARNRFDASSVFVLYEQILPDDPFGQTMCNNLQKRGCTLLSIRDHPSLESQQQRFLDAHWARAYALDMNTIYESILDRDDVRRIEKLELFDEFEEWHLIQAHYCVAVAFSSANDFTSGIFDAFASLAWPKKPTFHR